MNASILKMDNGSRVVSAYVQESVLSDADESTYPQVGVVLARHRTHWVTWRVMFNATTGCWHPSNGHYYEDSYEATLNFHRRISTLQACQLVGE